MRSASRASLCKDGRRPHAGGAARLPAPSQRWAGPGHGQRRQALPRVAKAIPISGWLSGRHCQVWGSLATTERILLGSMEFLDAKREQAHPSTLIKTTVRLTPLLPLALDVAWEYQVGGLVIFPNSGQEKWQGEFLHSTKAAEGQLSGICSLQGMGGPSPPGGGGRTERRAGWGMWYLHHGSHQAGLLLQLAPSQRRSFHQTQAAVFPQPCKTLNFTFTHFSSSTLH